MSDQLQPISQDDNVRLLTRQLEEEKKKVAVLEQQLQRYEQNGAAKLYYSLNRKMNEMGDMLNKADLTKIDIGEPKDKTFDRLKYIWSDAASISIAVRSLGESVGITGNEEKDVARKPFVDTIADPRN